MIIFDDIITDMINNKKLHPVVTELFIRGRLSLLRNLILKCQKMLD